MSYRETLDDGNLTQSRKEINFWRSGVPALAALRETFSEQTDARLHGQTFAR
jgi:hypothetical protein